MDILGRSEVWVDAMNRLEALSRPRGDPVLLLGEPGTGRRTLAAWIHKRRRSGSGHFALFDCAGGDEVELRDALYRIGQRMRDRGECSRPAVATLCLANFDDAEASVQVAMRALLGGVRGDSEIAGASAEVLVLLTSAKSRAELLETPEFDKELVFIGTSLEVRVPPLRERDGDAILLAKSFLEEARRDIGGESAPLSNALLEAISRGPWPGNVTQLRSLMRRFFVLRDESELLREILGSEDVPAEVSAAPVTPLAGIPLRELERRAIVETLAKFRGNKAKTAKTLGISRRALYDKLEKLGVEKPPQA